MQPWEIWEPARLSWRGHGFSGRLIVVDGIDGAGKTTMFKQLAEYLSGSGLFVVESRTPSDDFRQTKAMKAWNDLGYGISRHQLQLGLTVMACGDRLMHEAAVVEPALRQGKVIILDRYVFTSPVHVISDIHVALGSSLIRPDLGIVIDASPSLAYSRVCQRQDEHRHPDELATMERHRDRYLQLAKVNGFSVVSSDERSVGDTFTQVRSITEQVLRL